jgi:hypothetical protein
MQLFESGAMLQAVMQDSGAADLTSLEGVKEAMGPGGQGQGQEGGAEIARSRAQEMEARSGTPGSSTIPRQTAEAGFREARQSNTGAPRR